MHPVISYLMDTYHPRCILLYGSYADASQNSSSDVDALCRLDGSALLESLAQ